MNAAFAPGKYIGNTPEQVAASIGTYAFGRLFDKPKVAHLGMDLVQAQILSELLVEPIKFATQRTRPDNSNNQLVSVRARCGDVRDGDRDRAASRMEEEPAGIHDCVVRRGVTLAR